MESLSESSMEEEYEVEKILKERTRSEIDKETGQVLSVKEYLLKWVGYEEPTWEPEENLANCQELLKEFLLSQIIKKFNEDKKVKNNSKDKSHESISVNKNMKKMNNKKRKSPDSINMIEDEFDKDSTSVSNCVSVSRYRKNKKKKMEVEEIKETDSDMVYDIEIEKGDESKNSIKENNNKSKSTVNVKKEKNSMNKDDKGISGMKVIRINSMRIPDNLKDGISLNIKFEKNGKTFIENFNTKAELIPNDCLAKYYEMFILDNFKGCDFFKEMHFK